jgi:hypothetical protein
MPSKEAWVWIDREFNGKEATVNRVLDGSTFGSIWQHLVK